ncbi:hypothetical protein MED121_16034 [Marinomonas sp. MED121]|uniref:S24/S26 family peptidase n=1 Tax=Marinomonas sp. MED121 TaxID=314277 RepID=UPI0000691083|nr:S24/S26 family peptidase [Marinomonas sp. MED121]EAQ67452.1 hypothetical protein MED121_16034 [Marinomonas sp. MED121]
MKGFLCFYEVKGNSMLPFLRSGDFVIASRLFIAVSIDDLVLVRHPEYGHIIKRVAKTCPKKGLWLQGDGEQSVTSEQIGWISLAQVDAKALFFIKNKSVKHRGE